jgi:hypothetical protein
MKTIAIITAALCLVAVPSVFANGLIGETDQYLIYSYQYGNSQPATVYVRKEPTIAVTVHGQPAGAGSMQYEHASRDAEPRRYTVTIPGGIN